MCAACEGRLGLPWERRGGRLVRFFLTLRDLLVDPRRAFPAPPSPWPALGFFAISLGVAVLGRVPRQVRVWSRFEPRDAVLMLVWDAVGALLVPALGLFATSAAYRVSGWMARADVSWAGSLRAAAYASSLTLLLAPVDVLGGLHVIPRSARIMRTVWLVGAALLVPILQLRFWAAQAEHDTRARGFAFASLGPGLWILFQSLWLVFAMVALFR